MGHRKMEDKTKKTLYRVFWATIWVLYVPVYLGAAIVYLMTTPANHLVHYLAFLLEQTESFCRILFKIPSTISLLIMEAPTPTEFGKVLMEIIIDATDEAPLVLRKEYTKVHAETTDENDGEESWSD